MADLRNSYEKYESILYLKYKAFSVLINDKCKLVKVRVPLKYGFTNELVDQIVLYCYAGEAIEESPNMNPQIHKKIAIYSHHDRKQLMIFKQIENIDEFELIDWKNFLWKDMKPYYPAVFQISAPERGNLSEIMNTSILRMKSGTYVLSSYFNKIQQKSQPT